MIFDSVGLLADKRQESAAETKSRQQFQVRAQLIVDVGFEPMTSDL